MVLTVQELGSSGGRGSPVARPANMNHTPAPDRREQDSTNVNQVEDMETQDGKLTPLLKVQHCVN